VVVTEEETASSVRETVFDIYTKIIPGGRFKIKETGRVVEIENGFEMGIYPVTNSQYERFIEADGYNNDEYWSPEGIKWRKKEKISLPNYWQNDKWNKPDHPVVGVSWYESEAYCNWLTKHTGQNCRLPTEAEWEKAACWDEEKKVERVYPWGDEFDQDKCNTNQSGIGRTTPVNQYPQGRSPYGCYDMAGNVWEWCADWYSDEKASKVLRGGSWGLNQGYACCATRYYDYPYFRLNSIGFRVSRTKKP